MQNPISKRGIDYKNTDEYKLRTLIIEELKRKRKVALRLGTLKSTGGWNIYPRKLKELFSGKITFNDITPDDVYLELQQKGIDMKIGIDIASLALKRFVDKIVLISGDSDFVPAAKLARREGIDFVLDPMGANVEPNLFEHIDGLESFVYPKRAKKIPATPNQNNSTAPHPNPKQNNN